MTAFNEFNVLHEFSVLMRECNAHSTVENSPAVFAPKLGEGYFTETLPTWGGISRDSLNGSLPIKLAGTSPAEGVYFTNTGCAASTNYHPEGKNVLSN